MFNKITKEDRWNYIKKLFEEEKYNDCLKESEDFFKELKIDNDTFYLWKAHFEIAKCLKRIGKIQQAMKVAKSSLQHAYTASEKTQVCWMLGSCYENISQQKALKYYQRALLNSQYLGLYGFAYTLEFNIAKVNHNIQKMLEAVKLLESVADDDEFNKRLLNDTYKELFDIYIANNLHREALSVMHKVTKDNYKKYMITTIRQHKVVSI